MDLWINGEVRSVAAPLTIAALLEQLALPSTGIAVERNREIVLCTAYAQAELADGDELEIVTLVGGG